MITSSEDLRNSKVFMHYRTVRRWAAAYYKITSAEVELLISMHCKKRFTNEGFKDGEVTMTWDLKRFRRLKKDGWIDVYRDFWKTKEGKTIYKPSRKLNEMANKIYRILLGEEELPVNAKTPFNKNETYTDKTMLTAIEIAKRDIMGGDRAVY